MGTCSVHFSISSCCFSSDSFNFFFISYSFLSFSFYLFSSFCLISFCLIYSFSVTHLAQNTFLLFLLIGSFIIVESWSTFAMSHGTYEELCGTWIWSGFKLGHFPYLIRWTALLKDFLSHFPCLCNHSYFFLDILQCFLFLKLIDR